MQHALLWAGERLLHAACTGHAMMDNCTHYVLFIAHKWKALASIHRKQYLSRNM